MPSYLNGATVAASQAVVGTNSSGQIIQPPSQSQNMFFAAPSGSGGNPIFRFIVAADIPTLNQNTSGTAASATTAANLAGTNTNSIPYQSRLGNDELYKRRKQRGPCHERLGRTF